jgi:hypothetical protein
MKLKALWERYRSQRPLALPPRPPLVVRTRQPFQPLTRDESIAVLDDALQWLMDEMRSTLEMPEGPAKARRWGELRARDKSMAQDFRRLVREQEG